MKMIAMGDTHGDWASLNSFLNKKQPEIVLQCGDFGYWPRMHTAKQLKAQRKYGKDLPGPKAPEDTLLFWCDGNHEDHQELALRDTDELWPRIHYMPRGSLLDLPDGRRVMFLGGAASIDKNQRTMGIDWFPEEQISYADIDDLGYTGPVDIVISHTCPREFPLNIRGKGMGYFHDSSRDALSYVLETYRPSLWYFGHWHFYMTGYTMGCRWTALDCTSSHTQWWEEIRA